MKTVFVILLSLFVCINTYPKPRIYFLNQTEPNYITKQILLEANNISTWIQNTGTFDKDDRFSNAPGCMWPVESNRYIGFSAGLTIGAKVLNAIRLAAGSYKGELTSGYIYNGVPDSNLYFKPYKVTRGDGPANPDWANWYRMVPYGAPYFDVNNNGIFDPGIDTPGVKNAQQTIFICMTDGFTFTHNPSEGFSGGTAPLFAEIHLTGWGYTTQCFSDMQFLKWEIINKGANVWDSTFMSFVSDADLGDCEDDYIGCDTSRQLGYMYNYDNMDGDGNPPSYGANPPAAGMIMLNGATIKGANPINLHMSSFVYFTGSSSGSLMCELEPGTPQEAYYFLQGRKKDGSFWHHPYTKQRVFKVYTGNPETFTGWTEFGYNGNTNMAQIKNCNGGDTLSTFNNPTGDRRYIMGTGAPNLIVSPGDTQKILICKLVARGVNNLNSVTKLKHISDIAWRFYNSGFEFHSVSGTVRYTDNNQPVTSGIVKAIKYDYYNESILVLDSAYIQSDGTYLLSHVPQDSVDIGLYPVTTPPRDYLMSYYPSTIYWEDATTIYPTGNLTNINLGAIRIQETTASNSVNGKVSGLSDLFAGGLRDANVYAKSGNTFVRCTTTDINGMYHLASLPSGTLKIIVDRMGYKGDSTNVTVTSTSNIDSVNFYLNRIYVGIRQTETQIPLGFTLGQNYPNPFNPVTNIGFGLPANGYVKLTVYNMLGQEMATLIDGTMAAGSYAVTWNASDYPSGVYFYRMQFRSVSGITGDFVQTRKMALVK